MPPKLSQRGYADFTLKNRVRLVRGGKDFFETLLQLIQKATDTIHLQVYIFDDDETGNLVATALKEAVKRKVQVYLLADGYASQVMSQSFINSLKAAGINFRFFQPLFKSKSFYFGRRLHHKVLVVDNSYAMVGGINIANRYNDMPGYPAWLDFAVYAEGEIAKELCVLCWKTWKNFPAKMGSTPCEEKLLCFDFNSTESSLVRMRRNDWVRRKNQISSSYVEMLLKAQSHVTILCSYFLPGRVIQKHLFNAAKRGVKIRIILTGLSDVIFAKQAERYIYNRLLRNNIEIYEYNGTVLHGKIATCDSNWVTVGSYNINNISAYASIELNLDILDPSFAQKTEEALENIINNQSIQILEKDFIKKSNLLKQFARWVSYQVIQTGIFLFTFYFKRKN
jgi:cardiolipin synthase